MFLSGDMVVRATKTENVMVTGWNWVLLTDIACFKPAIFPEDNPADFGLFFDRCPHCRKVFGFQTGGSDVLSRSFNSC